MNFGERPPLILRLADRPPDDLDRLLRAFFRAEMPKPWPMLSPPEVEQTVPVRPTPKRGAVLRRRLAVAAAVAFLMIGSLVLTRSFPGSPIGGGLHLDPHKGIGHLDRPKVSTPQSLIPLGPGAEIVPEQIDSTRHGDAKSWGQRWPNGRILMQVEPVGKGRDR